jgi:hypothetical protein
MKAENDLKISFPVWFKCSSPYICDGYTGFSFCQKKKVKGKGNERERKGKGKRKNKSQIKILILLKIPYFSVYIY